MSRPRRDGGKKKIEYGSVRGEIDSYEYCMVDMGPSHDIKSQDLQTIHSSSSVQTTQNAQLKSHRHQRVGCGVKRGGDHTYSILLKHNDTRVVQSSPTYERDIDIMKVNTTNDPNRHYKLSIQNEINVAQPSTSYERDIDVMKMTASFSKKNTVQNTSPPYTAAVYLQCENKRKLPGDTAHNEFEIEIDTVKQEYSSFTPVGDGSIINSESEHSKDFYVKQELPELEYGVIENDVQLEQPDDYVDVNYWRDLDGDNQLKTPVISTNGIETVFSRNVDTMKPSRNRKARQKPSSENIRSVHGNKAGVNISNNATTCKMSKYEQIQTMSNKTSEENDSLHFRQLYHDCLVNQPMIKLVNCMDKVKKESTSTCDTTSTSTINTADKGTDFRCSPVDERSPTCSSEPPHPTQDSNQEVAEPLITLNLKDKTNGSTCPVCRQTMRTKHSLDRHMRLHTGYKPYSCDLCSKKFTRKDSLKVHARQSHKTPKTPTCTVCNMSFEDVVGLNNHMKVFHIRRIYMCTVCEKSFKNADVLRKHLQNHTAVPSKSEPHQNSPSCTQCSFRTTHKSTLLRHYDMVHGSESGRKTASESGTFKCDICDFCSSTLEDVKSHTKYKHREHSGLVIIQLKSSIVKCKFCSYTRDTPRNVRRHVKLKHPETCDTQAVVTVQSGLYKCSVCSYVSGFHANIRKHARQTHAAQCPSQLQTVDAKMAVIKTERAKINDGKQRHGSYKSSSSISESTPCSKKLPGHQGQPRAIKGHMTVATVTDENSLHTNSTADANGSTEVEMGPRPHAIRMKSGIYKCSLCFYSYNSASIVRRHITVKHRLNMSDKSSKVKSSTEDHRQKPQVVRMMNGMYKCSSCFYSNNSISIVRRHITVKHLLNKSKESLQTNITAENSTLSEVDIAPKIVRMKNGMFKCSSCFYSNDSASIVRRHITVKHQLNKSKESLQADMPAKNSTLSEVDIAPKIVRMKNGMFKCSSCFYSNDSASIVRRHITVKHLFKQSEKFVKANSIGEANSHRPQVVKLKNQMYKCSSCFYSNNSVSIVRRHITVKHLFSKSEKSLPANSTVENSGPPEVDVGPKIVRVENGTYKCSACFYSNNSPSIVRRHITVKHTKQSVKTSMKQKDRTCLDSGFHDKLQNEKLSFQPMISETSPVTKHGIGASGPDINEGIVSMHGKYKCKYCSFITRYRANACRHIRIFHLPAGKREQRRKISKKSRRARGNSGGVLQYVELKGGMLKCRYCDFASYTTKQVKSHCTQKHKDIPGKTKVCINSPCVESQDIEVEDNTKKPVSSGILSVEKESGTKSRYLFKCKFCDYTTIWSGNFRHHLHKKHIEKFQNSPYKSPMTVDLLELDDFRDMNFVQTPRGEEDSVEFSPSSRGYVGGNLPNSSDHAFVGKVPAAQKSVRQYDCSLCNFQTKWTHSITRHVKNHHKDEIASSRVLPQPKNVEVREASGATCSSQVDPNDEPRRLKNSSGENDKGCASFNTEGSGEALKVRATVSRKKPFVCSNCGYVTFKKSHYQRHIKKLEMKGQCGRVLKPKSGSNNKLHSSVLLRCNIEKVGRKYKCTKCQYATLWSTNARRHFDRNHKGAENECKFLDRKFSDVAVLEGLIDRHHWLKSYVERSIISVKYLGKSSRYTCNLCGYSSTYLSYMRRHMPRHKCEIDGTKAVASIKNTSNDTSGVAMEQSDKIENVVGADDEANQAKIVPSTSSVDVFEKCKESHDGDASNVAKKDGGTSSGNETFPFSCDICGFNTRHAYSLKIHMRFHGNDLDRCSVPSDAADIQSLPELKQSPSSRTSSSPVSQNSRKNQLFSCKFCEKTYPMKASCDRHMYWHKYDNFECLECNTKFAFPQSMLRHIRKQHGLKCSVCGHLSRNSREFNQHVQYHKRKSKTVGANTDSVQYDESPRRKSRVHSSISTDCEVNEVSEVLPFTCEICRYVFRTSRMYDMHMKRHENETKCGVCEFRTKYTYSLTCHMRTHGICDLSGLKANQYAEFKGDVSEANGDFGSVGDACYESVTTKVNLVDASLIENEIAIKNTSDDPVSSLLLLENATKKDENVCEISPTCDKLSPPLEHPVLTPIILTRESLSDNTTVESSSFRNSTEYRNTEDYSQVDKVLPSSSDAIDDHFSKSTTLTRESATKDCAYGLLNGIVDVICESLQIAEKDGSAMISENASGENRLGTSACSPHVLENDFVIMIDKDGGASGNAGRGSVDDTNDTLDDFEAASTEHEQMPRHDELPEEITQVEDQHHRDDKSVSHDDLLGVDNRQMKSNFLTSDKISMSERSYFGEYRRKDQHVSEIGEITVLKGNIFDNKEIVSKNDTTSDCGQSFSAPNSVDNATSNFIKLSTNADNRDQNISEDRTVEDSTGILEEISASLITVGTSSEIGSSGLISINNNSENEISAIKQNSPSREFDLQISLDNMKSEKSEYEHDEQCIFQDSLRHNGAKSTLLGDTTDVRINENQIATENIGIQETTGGRNILPIKEEIFNAEYRVISEDEQLCETSTNGEKCSGGNKVIYSEEKDSVKDALSSVENYNRASGENDLDLKPAKLEMSDDGLSNVSEMDDIDADETDTSDSNTDHSNTGTCTGIASLVKECLLSDPYVKLVDCEDVIRMFGTTDDVSNDQCDKTETHIHQQLSKDAHCQKRDETGVEIEKAKSLRMKININECKKICDGKKKYACPLCPVKYNWPNNLRIHWKKHTGENRLVCSLCNRGFVNLRNLQMHELTHQLKCSLCSETFTSNETLRGHLEHHDRLKLYKCEVCGFDASSAVDLILHSRKHSQSVFPCRVEGCDKRYSLMSHLQSHMRVHIGPGLHPCLLCDEKFSTFKDLTRHKRAHTNRDRYKCTTCDYTTLHPANLLRHRRIHTDTPAFSCKFCKYRCNDAPTMYRHENIHLRKQLYHCDVCSKSFVSKGNLKIHGYTHTNERRYRCQYCEKAYVNKHYLQLHVASVHFSELHRCEICEFRTKRGGNFALHMKRHERDGLTLENVARLRRIYMNQQKKDEEASAKSGNVEFECVDSNMVDKDIWEDEYVGNSDDVEMDKPDMSEMDVLEKVVESDNQRQEVIDRADLVDGGKPVNNLVGQKVEGDKEWEEDDTMKDNVDGEVVAVANKLLETVVEDMVMREGGGDCLRHVLVNDAIEGTVCRELPSEAVDKMRWESGKSEQRTDESLTFKGVAKCGISAEDSHNEAAVKRTVALAENEDPVGINEYFSECVDKFRLKQNDNETIGEMPVVSEDDGECKLDVDKGSERVLLDREVDKIGHSNDCSAGDKWLVGTDFYENERERQEDAVGRTVLSIVDKIVDAAGEKQMQNGAQVIVSAEEEFGKNLNEKIKLVQVKEEMLTNEYEAIDQHFSNDLYGTENCLQLVSCLDSMDAMVSSGGIEVKSEVLEDHDVLVRECIVRKPYIKMVDCGIRSEKLLSMKTEEYDIQDAAREITNLYRDIHPNRGVVCKVCGHRFPHYEALQKHFRSHSREKPYECLICQRRFGYLSNFRLHQTIHSGERKFVCSECGKQFKRSTHLKQHSLLHLKTKPLKCKHCDFASNARCNLIRHNRIHTGEKPYTCTYCTYTCRDGGTLTKHIRSHTGEKPFKCEYCGLAFANSGNLKGHRRTHLQVEKRFTCEICEKSFYYLSSLRQHMRVHSDEKPYSCNQCVYATRFRNSLRLHKLIHSKVKLFKCSYCNYAGNYKTALKRHIRTHTGERPYRCAKCNYSSSSFRSLKRHDAKHTGNKPFRCTNCDYRCVEKDDLRSHRMTHLVEKRFKCNRCKFRTNYRTSLLHHKVNKHS